MQVSTFKHRIVLSMNIERIKNLRQRTKPLTFSVYTVYKAVKDTKKIY